MIKIARSHLINTIEHSLQVSGPVSDTYPRYVLEATPYRIPGKKGNSGVRVIWRERGEKEWAEAKPTKAKKSAKKAGKK